MNIATIIIRSLIGLLLLFASITYFFDLIKQPELTGDFKTFQDGLVASVYLMPLAKAVELICGLSYATNRYVTLTNLVLLPVTLNILLINVFLAPDGIPIALPLFLGNVFMIYRHWNNYKSLFNAR